MKKIFTLLVLSLTLFANNAKAQGYVDYSHKWFLGLNFGGTYHSNTEVKVNNLYRGGFGFTFGRSFNYNKGNVISWDLRVRYLLAAYRGLSDEKYMLDSTNYNVLDLGQDLQKYQQAYGYYKPNFHSWVNDWSLELQLNTNLLRERTGWNLFVFGGIGTTRYNTRTDLYDNDFLLNIKPENKLDEKGQYFSDYETKVVERREWMPSFGAGISKQITPNISFEIMGRMTWTRHNDFDGVPTNFDGSTSPNDRYHYASAGFKFRLNGNAGGSGSTSTYQDGTDNSTNSNINNNTNGGAATPQKPIVDFTNPSTTPYTTNQPIFNLKANVYYVYQNTNVKFTQNGVDKPFTYNQNTNDFNAQVTLVEGQNVFDLTGTNNVGQDHDQVVIIYEKKTPPVVTITNPSSSGLTVEQPDFNFRAIVLNVDGKQNITVTFNGNNLPNFNFNPNTNQLQTNLVLNEGTNTVSVKGVNADGEDTESTTIIYNKPKPPVVDITMPSSNPYTTSNSSEIVKATVLHVEGKQNITVKYNGFTVADNGYTFNTSNHVLTLNLNNLILGVNTILITATNNVGQDSDQTVIIKTRTNQETKNPPTVNFTNPAAPNSVVSNPQYTVKAVTTNITSKGQVTVKHNNVTLNSTLYSFSNAYVNIPVTLVDGVNTFEIYVSNADGNDQAVTNIKYLKIDDEPCVTPTIGYVAPQPNSTVTNSNVNIQAQINNYIPGTTVKLYKNNVYVSDMTYNSATSLASKQVSLSTGANAFKITVSNRCGNNQSTFNLNYTVPCDLPAISSISPLNNTTLSNSNTTISAVISNYLPGTSVQLYKNNVLLGNMTYNSMTQIASKDVTLIDGINNYTIKVQSNCGQAQENISLNYKTTIIPCNAPVLTMVQPTTNVFTTNNANEALEFSVTEIATASQIEVTNNNVVIPFNFNTLTKKININVSLQGGLNSVLVKVTNDCGTDKKIVKITRERCVSPVITINNTNTTVTNNIYTLNAIVTNVTNSSEITLKLNGQNKNFSFNQQTGELVATLSLNQGNNVIELEANTCKTISKTLTVNYSIPCTPPTVILKSNNQSPNENYTYVAIINGEITQSDVVLTLNGNTVPFTWTANGTDTYTLTSDLILNSGSNSITLTLNGCETVTNNLNVTNTCVAPVFTVNVSETVTNQMYILMGAVVNATSLAVTLNGSNVTPNFNTNTGNFSVNLNLNEGNNTIILKAMGCEETVKEYNVVYEKPCITPQIQISDTVTTSNTLTLTFAVAGEITQSDISVTGLGGVGPLGYVAFNNNLHQVTVDITLIEGVNTITITINGCETVVETIVVNYVSNSGHDSPGHEGPNSENNATDTTSNSHDDSSNTGSSQTGNQGANSQNNATGTTGNAHDNSNTGNSNNNSSQPCGPRFNPGNADWQFCLITPSGSYSRADLVANPNFTYSGPASSIYFKPIAGGGDVTLNGAPYVVQNGKYYLFTGNLTVDVSSSHPGSMGHWEVCLTADQTPVFGTGNSRPISPCEDADGGKVQAPAPVITRVSPKSTTVTVSNSTYLFKANIEHINGKADIQLYVNGVKQSNFIYSTKNNQVSTVVRLKNGQNTIKVIAKTPSGSDTEDVIITYKAASATPKTTTPKKTGTKTATPKTDTKTGTTKTSGDTKTIGTKTSTNKTATKTSTPTKTNTPTNTKTSTPTKKETEPTETKKTLKKG